MFKCGMSDSWQIILLQISNLTKLFISGKPLDYKMWLWRPCFVREQMVQFLVRLDQHFLFSFSFWSKSCFPSVKASTYWPGCWPPCGQSLSLSFLPVESASQLLSLVYLFLLSRCAGHIKCYYRLPPLTFVSLTMTFTGNLRKTINETSPWAI